MRRNVQGGFQPFSQKTTERVEILYRDIFGGTGLGFTLPRAVPSAIPYCQSFQSLDSSHGLYKEEIPAYAQTN